ncbi:hypothetical protein Kpho01_40990 [Kitasatospora phosalacinea]|uniref:Uncharacterized protein n=1 Tax=Kitasatospora phosalacinea TaxID=2065 RepID=A0A9W6PJM2_9ACTN|nr:hypothetical protein Kpho01_40990 [Kitasatospora phosalacinea]
MLPGRYDRSGEIHCLPWTLHPVRDAEAYGVAVRAADAAFEAAGERGRGGGPGRVPGRALSQARVPFFER